MADNKKYYYLKLKENFFDTEEMKIMQSRQDGYIYSDILLKLYLKSLKSGGRLMYRGIIPYTSDLIAALTNHQVGTVEKALEVFRQLGLIEILDNGAIYMMDIQNFIGRSSSEADRKREYRNMVNAEKQAVLEQFEGQMSGQMSGQTSDKCQDISPPKIRDKSINNRSINTSIARSSEKQTSEPQEKVFITLQLNTGEEYPIYDKEIKEWEELYPAVDVKQQLRSMKGWLLANKAKRKTKRGINRFINNWLSREQDRGGRRQPAGSGYQKTSGNGYGERLNELAQESRGDLDG